MPEIEISAHKCRRIIDLTTKYFANMSKEDAAQFKRFRKWYQNNSTQNLKEFWAIENTAARAK